MRGTHFRGCGSRLLHESTEAVQVELLSPNPQHVAGRLRNQDVRTENLPQLRDEVLERRRRGPRRLLAPQDVDQTVRRDNATRVQQEEGEHRALFRPAQRESLVAVAHFERAKYEELELAPRCADRNLGGLAELLFMPGDTGRCKSRGAGRGEVERHVVDDELREPLWPVEILEQMLAEVAERHAVRKIVFDQSACDG